MGYYAVKTPKLLKAYYPKLLWNRSREAKKIYLTFDDGPTPEITTWVLKCLDTYHAKATFFCIGKNILKHPEIIKLVMSKGHRIGNHTFLHENGWNTTHENYLESIHKTDTCIKNLGTETTLFRPPYGKIKKKQIKTLKNLGYTIVMWDVLSADFDESLHANDCYLNVTKHATNGSIIVFHDSIKAESRLKESLPRILGFLKNKGFSFEVLP